MKQSNDFQVRQSNYCQVRQSNYFQTEQEVSGSISPPKINPADCQDRDGLGLVACQDELRLAAGIIEIPPGQLVAVQSKVECGSSTFYIGGTTLYLARRLGLVDIIEEGTENVTADSRVETSGDKQTDVGFECRSCNKKFRKPKKLKNHIRRVHKGDRDIRATLWEEIGGK